MNDNEVIAKLTRQNLILQEEKEYRIEALRNIKVSLISIGAPLNDNVLRYNKKQLRVFFDILGQVNNVLPSREE